MRTDGMDKPWDLLGNTLKMATFALILAALAVSRNHLIIGASVGVLGLLIVLVLFSHYGEKVPTLIFFLFMGLTILFNRSFSHIALPKPPFYVTEMTMALLTVMLWYKGQLVIPRAMRPWLLWIGAVMMIGLIFNGPRFGWLAVIRDSAELYYIWFVPLSYSLYRLALPLLSRRTVEWGLATALWLVPLVYLATASIQLPSAAESVSAMLILTLFIWEWHDVPPAMIWPALILNMVSLMRWGARGPWVGFAFAVMVLLTLAPKVNGQFLARLQREAMVSVGVCLWLLGVLWLVDQPLLAHILQDLKSLTTFHGHYSQIANNRWRLIIWEEAAKQILSNPYAIRVGQPWIPEKLVSLGYGGWNATQGFAQNTVALSNSYLQMMQWYGIWAIIPVAMMVYHSLKHLFQVRPLGPNQVLISTFLAIWAVVTGVEVVLEGPYMSAIVWSLVGLAWYFPQWHSVHKKEGAA